jgi:tetratricopeptide (TPR) repeat protein
MESIRVLELKGSIEFRAEDLDGASDTYQEIMRLGQALEEAPPSIAEEARVSYIAAVSSLGQIQHDQEQGEAALVLFREEIKLREQATRNRPYDAEERVALAAAYAMASSCLDLENDTSRSLAIFYLEQGISLIGSLPSEVRNRGNVQAQVLEYNDRLSKILEMDE